MKIAVIGGGAAGFFAALRAKQLSPNAEVIILEKSVKLLTKVRISGGGRCNVTHGCFDPRQLVENYPRGRKELLGLFYRFQPLDTIKWFTDRGVNLKQEGDGRIFPVSNSSETIIDCLLKQAQQLDVLIRTKANVKKIYKNEKKINIEINKDELITVDKIILATGGSQDGFRFASMLGHTIKAPVSSLFTFNIHQFDLANLAGVSLDNVKLKISNSKFKNEGPLLITHWGFSGPVILKLSSFAARFLSEKNYDATLVVDWIPNFTKEMLLRQIEVEKLAHPLKQLTNLNIFHFPKKLWKALCERFKMPENLPLNKLSKKAMVVFCENLKNDCFNILGKTTNKEEFVTCGGVLLSEVNFQTMESKVCKNVFLCGEILDIDGITGGFNFQNAWTTGWIAGMSSVVD